MRFEGAFLKSRVARRIFLLFFASALLPAAALGFISYYQVRSQLQEQSRQRISETAKSVGMSLVERIDLLSTELMLLSSQFDPESDAQTAHRQLRAERFKSLAIQWPDGSTLQLIGDLEPPVNLDEKQRQHLERAPLLYPIAKPEGRARFLLAIRGSGTLPEGSILWGEASSAFLLSINPDEDFSPSMELAILDDRGQCLFSSSSEGREGAEKVFDEQLTGGFGNLLWTRDGQPFQSAYRSMPIGVQFGLPFLTVVVSQSAAEANRPIEQFKGLFPYVIMGSLLLVAFLSSSQIRRSLNPLEQLRDGTRRIARADFGTRVDVRSRDEFQELADSFNTMAIQLGNQFNTLETVSEIDRAILSALHTKEIVLTVLRRIPGLLGAPQICLIIADSEEALKATAYTAHGESGGRPRITQVSISPDLLDSLAGNGDGAFVPREDLPGCFGAGGFNPQGAYLLPVKIRNSISALLALGYFDGSQISPGSLETARRLADQIAVALSNARLLEELDDLNWSALTALARTVDAKSPWTAGHSERVTNAALMLGERLGLSEKELEVIKRGGLLHDIGKIGIPPEVLDKPGRLTEPEFKIMMQHPSIGARILQPVKAFADVIPIVLHHHERIDGRGYPHGLAGEEIRFDVRILTVADVFDALYSDRPYRARKNFDDVVEIIQQGAGTQFDSSVVRVFMEMVKKERTLLEENYSRRQNAEYQIFTA